MSNTNKIVFLCIATLIFCNSCALNRTVRLFILEPSAYEEENGVRFIAKSNGNYGYWMLFVSPHLPNSRPEVLFNIAVYSDHIIEKLFLESVSADIEDLGIIVSKENLQKPIKILYKEDTLSWQNPIEEESYAFVMINDVIYTDEIRDAISKKLTMTQAHKKFKKVDDVRFLLTFRYTINGEEKTSTVPFTYETIYQTSLAWIDTLMSV
jgi:hypothetical protein